MELEAHRSLDKILVVSVLKKKMINHFFSNDFDRSTVNIIF